MRSLFLQRNKPFRHLLPCSEVCTWACVCVCARVCLYLCVCLSLCLCMCVCYLQSMSQNTLRLTSWSQLKHYFSSVLLAYLFVGFYFYSPTSATRKTPIHRSYKRWMPIENTGLKQWNNPRVFLFLILKALPKRKDHRLPALCSVTETQQFREWKTRVKSFLHVHHWLVGLKCPTAFPEQMGD